MNRVKANEIFQAYGRPQFKTGNNTTISFARQTESDLEEIESKTDDELVKQWKSLMFMNYIYGSVSLNDMQRITLIELEFEDRKNISAEELQAWLSKAEDDFAEQESQF